MNSMNYLSCSQNLDRLVERFKELYPGLVPTGGTLHETIKGCLDREMQWFWDDDEVDDICNDLAESGWFDESLSQVK